MCSAEGQRVGHDGPVTIELSVLAHPSDLPFLEPTLRHQLRHFAASTAVSRRVVVADYALATPEAAGQLRRLLGHLADEGAIDDVREVDWAPAAVESAMNRWFGSPDVSPRAGRTRARYQYAYSIDVAQRDLVLHLDSDVLFWGSLTWIETAPATFAEAEHLLAIVPMAGPPQARTPKEWLLGPRVGRSQWPLGPQTSEAITTRHVLLHRQRLLEICPLVASADEHFEASVSRAMRAAELQRLTTIGSESLAWHPHDHNSNHARGVEHLIRVVEAGGYPFRRWGQPWDIATAGRGYIPWRLARPRQQRSGWAAHDERD